MSWQVRFRSPVSCEVLTAFVAILRHRQYKTRVQIRCRVITSSARFWTVAMQSARSRLLSGPESGKHTQHFQFGEATLVTVLARQRRHGADDQAADASDAVLDVRIEKLVAGPGASSFRIASAPTGFPNT